MKVIDLLNKIANGEEVPKEIKYDGLKWNFEEDKLYYSDNIWLDDYCNLSQCLNDEVEIIGEDKKIEKIKILNCDNYVKKENYETILTMQEIALDIQTLRHKLDEIIDYLEEKNNE